MLCYTSKLYEMPQNTVVAAALHCFSMGPVFLLSDAAQWDSILPQNIGVQSMGGRTKVFDAIVEILFNAEVAI